MKKENRFLTLIFLFYIGILFRITVFRSGFSFFSVFENGRVYWIPFVDLIAMVQQKEWIRFCYLFFGNIVWFIPFGSYFLFLKPEMSLFKVGIFGFFVSFLIETLQYVFGTGYSEVDDLILNTLGVLIGAGVMKILKKYR